MMNGLQRRKYSDHSETPEEREERIKDRQYDNLTPEQKALAHKRLRPEWKPPMFKINPVPHEGKDSENIST